MSKLSGVLVTVIPSMILFRKSFLMPFDGINPYSVVVLDNCTIHHTAEVKSV